MKNRTLLAKKLEIFHNGIKSKRSGKIRLHTDLEFNQNKIKELIVMAERLKKKDAPRKLFKASTKIKPFFNRNQIFTIYKRVKLNNGSYLYWVEEDGKKINGRFLRQERIVCGK